MPLALITDDDQHIRALFKDALETVGFTVLLAADVTKAISVLEQNTPDIAFVDLNMPGRMGTELVRYLKNTPRLTQTKIVVVTANTQAESTVEALGADLVLEKPVAIHEMMVLAQRLLS